MWKDFSLAWRDDFSSCGRLWDRVFFRKPNTPLLSGVGVDFLTLREKHLPLMEADERRWGIIRKSLEVIQRVADLPWHGGICMENNDRLAHWRPFC